MYIQVKLLHGYSQPLWYYVSQKLTHSVTKGSIVQVPLRAQTVSAVVTHITSYKPAVSFEIKEINRLEPFPTDFCYTTFINQLAAYHALEPTYFLKRIAHFMQKKPKNIIPYPLHSSVHNTTPVIGELQILPSINQQAPLSYPLTPEQQKVADFITSALETPTYTPTVLHGVTASGKTEVYKTIITHAFNHNKTTILLLPEVTLAQTFEKRLRAEMGDHLPLYGFHSGTTQKEKSALWNKLLTQEPLIIIGVHLPIILPIARLGLIIVDEEHEVGYQEKKYPKINSRDAAIMRAHCNQIPILLGSATPSLATLYNIKKRGWHFFQLKQRFAGSFPHVHIVSLADKNDRKQFWISQHLYDAIKKRLNNNEQVLIFINRRGFSFFVQCKACSFIFKCTTCSVSLTLHSNNMLSCHYCGQSTRQPTQCPSCAKTYFIKKGVGTQQIVTILETLFPTARIARADKDSTSKKKEWAHTLHQFMSGALDILVGTQTITKGYDFPHVTLVGIIWADLHLHFPLFNAVETSLQQLIQVAGRAGRHRAHSEVIVQTLSDHPVFDYIHEIDYLTFYTKELEKRTLLDYPPYKRLVEIELKSPNEQAVEKEAHDLVHALLAQHKKNPSDIQILGPAKPPVHTIKNIHSRKLYIKGAHLSHILELFKSINTAHYTSIIYYIPNPVA